MKRNDFIIFKCALLFLMACTVLGCTENDNDNMVSFTKGNDSTENIEREGENELLDCLSYRVDHVKYKDKEGNELYYETIHLDGEGDSLQRIEEDINNNSIKAMDAERCSNIGIIRIDSRVISISVLYIDIDGYRIESHSLNYDMISGNRIGIDWVYKDKDAFYDLVKKGAKEGIEWCDNEITDLEEIESKLDNIEYEIENSKVVNWYVAYDGIRIDLISANHKVILPYTISYKELSGIINEEYIPQFGKAEGIVSLNCDILLPNGETIEVEKGLNSDEYRINYKDYSEIHTINGSRGMIVFDKNGEGRLLVFDQLEDDLDRVQIISLNNDNPGVISINCYGAYISMENINSVLIYESPDSEVQPKKYRINDDCTKLSDEID